MISELYCVGKHLVTMNLPPEEIFTAELYDYSNIFTVFDFGYVQNPLNVFYTTLNDF